jgi:hypothetical protein
VALRVAVSDWVDPVGALEPAAASRLADHLIKEKGTHIVLDFSEVRAISSAFANALFMGLAQAMPLDAWREILSFDGLDARKAEVLAKSRVAVLETRSPGARP